MVILIGGVGHAGKTLMAQKLLEKYKTPYLSMDHLKMGLYRADPIGCGFTPLDSQSVIGEKLCPILRGIIMTNIENRQHLIIEGIYLLPWRVAELDKEYLRDIVSFYLLFSEEYIHKHFTSDIWEHRCAIEARGDDDDFTLEEFIEDNRRQRLMRGIRRNVF